MPISATLKMRLIAAVTCAILLAGCATPTPREVTIFDAGPQPNDEQAKDVVLEFLQRNLKDPDSLKQFKMLSSPRLATWYRGRSLGGGNDRGWLVCFEYNAKNSYGGYVGVKTDRVVLRSADGVLHVVSSWNWEDSDALC